VLDDPRLVRHVELQQLALLALGMLHEDAAEVVPYVVELMARPWLDRLVLAQAPIALVRLAVSDSGRSAASATLPRLLALLRERTTERELRRSTVIALGRLGTTDDSEVIEALGEVVARSDDSIARHFALIALGEIANSDAAPAQHAEAQTRVELLLERELESPRRSEHRAFAALALGIRARNAALAPPARERTTTWLLELFESSRSPSHRAALALALGLARESRAAAPIAAAFEGSKDAAHQGYLALAIGMLNAREQAPSLLRQLAASRLDPVLEVRLARALAQLAPKAAAEALVARLRAADTTNETSLTALALAQTGEAIALAPLVELAADESLPSARRGVAAESLGVLHSSSAPSWKSVFEADTNYLTRTPSLNQLVMLF